MVENAHTTTTESSTVTSNNTPEKRRGRKDTSGDRRQKSGGKESNIDVKNNSNWSQADEVDDFDSDGEWEVEEDPGIESPSTWDPKELQEQTNNIGAWKDSHEPNRVQDLPSPSLADPREEERKSKPDDEDEWPFKSACAFEQKNRHRRLEKSNKSVSSDMDSVGQVKRQNGRVPEKGTSLDMNELHQDEVEEDEDINDNEDNDRIQAWKMRESWKGRSQHSNNSDKIGTGGGRKSGNDEPSGLGSRSNRPDADDDGIDHPPTNPKPRANHSVSAGDDDIDDDDDVDRDVDESRVAKPRRSASRRGSNGGDGELGGNSFHCLRRDPDKPRSASRGKRTPTGSRARTPTGGRPTRRRVKDKTLEYSSHPAEDENGDIVDDTVESLQVKLKGEEYDTPGRKSAWRERRKSRERSHSDDGPQDFETELTTIEAPRSGGRRPPPSRRMQIHRAHSERWMRAVEGVEDRGSDDPQTIKRRAHDSLNRANDEMSQSAHNLRRHHSGGAFMSGNLDPRSYHGAESARRTPTDIRRRSSRNHESVDSAGSFGGDSYESFDRSTHSQRTLDSIEDFEDFGRMDFQTPGMVDFDVEIMDLMQRANPEVTAHLDRRVHRKRDQIMYDQNMPMMTRQALLTRQASAQVSKQYVDGSTIDRKRLLLRSDSMTSVNSHDELTLSNHRSLKGTPGRRAPPRSKSSGLGAMVPGAGPPRSSEPDDRRRVIRSRSGTGTGSGTNSFRQYPNKPNRVQSLSRRPSSGDQIDPHSARGAPIEPNSMRGTSSSSDSMMQPRPPQRAKSATSFKKPTSIDRIGPQKPERRAPKKDRDEMPDLRSFSSDDAFVDDASIDGDSEDSDVVSDDESLSPSPKKPPRRKPTKTLTNIMPFKSKSAPAGPLKKAPKSTDKKDMGNRRNRQKLHLLIYEVKMGVDMKGLFKQVREGDTPRSPIKTLMMPSP
jgi:hypothetical protein